MKTEIRLSYKQRLLILIIGSFIARGILAFTLQLGNDEAYYWLYSQRLQINYFDHPPVIALWIRLFTFNLALEGIEGFIRLGSVVSCALSTWMMYKTVTLLSTEKAAWYAACLYTFSFYASIVAGIFTWPDAPQMVFWTFCLWMIARICNNNTRTAWILLGIGAGCCIMSKVHGLFIPFGVALYAIFKKREWLTRPQVYLSLFIMLGIASPILLWNIEHDFVTYRFHSERITITETAIRGDSFGREILGQVFYNNPFNVFLILSALVAVYRSKAEKQAALSIYIFIGLPLAVILLLISFFRDTLPHWSGPAYVTLLPLAAIRAAEQPGTSFLPGLIKGSGIGYLLFIIGWPAVVHFYPGTFGNKTEQKLGKGDITLDIYNWREGGEAFAAFAKKEAARGRMPPYSPVISYKWWGAHIEYYFCRPAGLTMIGLGTTNNLHHYLWTNKWRGGKVNLDSAYCILPSDEYYDIAEAYAPYYTRMDSVKVIKTFRKGKPAHFFTVYRLTGWRGQLPLPPD